MLGYDTYADTASPSLLYCLHDDTHGVRLTFLS